MPGKNNSNLTTAVTSHANAAEKAKNPKNRKERQERREHQERQERTSSQRSNSSSENSLVPTMSVRNPSRANPSKCSNVVSRSSYTRGVQQGMRVESVRMLEGWSNASRSSSPKNKETATGGVSDKGVGLGVGEWGLRLLANIEGKG